jgi:GntR family transcriptional regulator / MocR family aminotransferase
MPKTQTDLTFISITVDKKSKVPLYQQLYTNLRDAILNCTIRTGQRLPATRQIAESLKISRNIVSMAFEQLTLEGYLTGKVGSGTFVSQTLPDNFLKSYTDSGKLAAKSEPKPDTSNFAVIPGKMVPRYSGKEDVLPFQNAVPAMDIFPLKIWYKIANRLYKDIGKHHLGYDDPAGNTPLRENIANYLRTARGVKCEYDQVLIINGTQQGLSLCAHMFINKGDDVLVEDPGYSGAKSAFVNYGATLCPVPVEEDGIDVKYITRNFRKPKLLYITPAHQYPLGGTLSLTKRMELLKWASKSQTWIIEDDYDSELRYTGRPLAALQGLDQDNKVIYIGTFSKVVFPGLRIAYMVLPNKQIAEYFTAVKAIFDRQFPVMEQLIINAFIEEGHFVRHLRKMRLAYYERQKMLIRAIEKELGDKLRVEEQPAGMHVVGWLPAKYNDREVSALLAKNGILANPLSDYSIRFEKRPALILGYTAFNKFKIRHYVQKMNQVIK